MVNEWISIQQWRVGLAIALGLLFWVLGLAGFCLFFLVEDAAFKRRWYRPFAILSSTVLVCAVIAMGLPPRLLFLFIPAIVLVSFLNIRSIRFCGRCGMTNGMNGLVGRPRFCAKCGAALET